MDLIRKDVDQQKRSEQEVESMIEIELEITRWSLADRSTTHPDLVGVEIPYQGPPVGSIRVM